MNVEIVSLNPFIVEMNLYNLLGEIDGHPRVRFDMKSGEFTLIHDKTYANLVSTSEHPLKGQPLVLTDDSPMCPIVRRRVAERIGHTGFHDKWATEAFNKHYVGDLNYPRYFFTMWDRKPDGEIRVHFIQAKEYEMLWEWEYQELNKRA